jgi:hypothetical protein
LSLLLTKYKEENFDAIIFQCLERALSTLGATQQEFVINTLEKEYHITSKNLGKEAFGLEEILRRILGPSVSSFVIMHTSDYVATEFKITPRYGSTLTQTVEVARRIYDEARPQIFPRK